MWGTVTSLVMNIGDGMKRFNFDLFKRTCDMWLMYFGYYYLWTLRLIRGEKDVDIYSQVVDK